VSSLIPPSQASILLLSPPAWPTLEATCYCRYCLCCLIFLDMASSFHSSLPFCQTPAIMVKTTVQPTPPFSRMMASGRCTVVWIAGKLKIPCPCLCGVFEAPLDVRCKECEHPLSQHEGDSSTPEPSTPAPASFQGMASFISSVHLRQLMDMFQAQPVIPHVSGKPRSPHSGISLIFTSLFMFEAHLAAGSPHWLNFSVIT
jgi:hypothetical protein